MKKNGFTLIELMITVTLLFFVFGLIIGVGFYGTLCKGNFWVGEQSGLKAVRLIDDSATSVVALERHVWGYSRITVKDAEGQKKEFYLDANILQNVSAYPAN